MPNHVWFNQKAINILSATRFDWLFFFVGYGRLRTPNRFIIYCFIFITRRHETRHFNKPQWDMKSFRVFVVTKKMNEMKRNDKSKVEQLVEEAFSANSFSSSERSAITSSNPLNESHAFARSDFQLLKSFGFLLSAHLTASHLLHELCSHAPIATSSHSPKHFHLPPQGSIN